MLVTPRKVQPVREKELRVIHIERSAIEELLWEHLMEHQALYFDTAAVNEDLICHMRWSEDGRHLIYALSPIWCAREGRVLDFDRIQKKVGPTAASLFQPHRYRRVKLTSSLFLPGEK